MLALCTTPQRSLPKKPHTARMESYVPLILIFWILTPDAVTQIVLQLKANMWVTLAKATSQDSICLSMGSAKDPLVMCLVELPLRPEEYSFTGRKCNPVDTWDDWIRELPHTPEEPQELDLLGSSRAAYCINFSGLFGIGRHHIVTPMKKVYQATDWCNYTNPVLLFNTYHYVALPQGVFLICRDRAWPGIPTLPRRGPCTLGRLSALTPNIALIQDWRKKNKLAPQKRELTTQFDENCDSQIVSWSWTKRTTASVFLPWVAAAMALGELSHLEWSVV